MANTRQSLGEATTLDRLVTTNALTTFEEDSADKISALYYGGDIVNIILKNIASIENINRMDALTSLEISGDYQCSFSDLSYNRKLNKFFIRNNKVSKTSSSAFNDTLIEACLAPVYVPSNLVDAYKADPYWKHFIIASINDYPVSDDVYVQITDTWEQIVAAENDGTYKTKYKIGDMKYVNINGEQLRAQIVAFDSDNLANNTEKAKITWLTKEVLPSHAYFTNVNDYNWENCELRNWLRTTIYNSLDGSLKNIIKNVTKSYYSNGKEYSVIDNLWVPSYHEMSGSTTYEKNGPSYKFFSDRNGSIYKYRVGSSSSSTWLTRTCTSFSGSSGSFVSNGYGSYSGISANNTYPEPVGFCT